MNFDRLSLIEFTIFVFAINIHFYAYLFICFVAMYDFKVHIMRYFGSHRRTKDLVHFFTSLNI